MSNNLTMFEKIWQKHIVAEPKDQPYPMIPAGGSVDQLIEEEKN